MVAPARKTPGPADGKAGAAARSSGKLALDSLRQEPALTQAADPQLADCPEVRSSIFFHLKLPHLAHPCDHDRVRKQVMGLADPTGTLCTNHTQMGGEYTMGTEAIIFTYTLNQAIQDGVLQPLGWAQGKPLMATRAIVNDLAIDEMRNLFMAFFDWQREVEPTLSEEDRMFVADASNEQTVWVIDDGAAITLLYPSDY
jgi:hypothetical protein